MGWTIWALKPSKGKIFFLFPEMFRLILRSTQHPVDKVTGVCSWPLASTTAKVKNERYNTSASLLHLYGVDGYNFTFTFC